MEADKAHNLVVASSNLASATITARMAVDTTAVETQRSFWCGI